MVVIGWLQVINAALALAAKPNSKVAQDNMDLFKEQWEKQVRVLTDAVDDITSIDDFLCVSGKSCSFACHSHEGTKEVFPNSCNGLDFIIRDAYRLNAVHNGGKTFL